MQNLVTTQNLNIYLNNYQTETTIFVATKHEKTIMTVIQFFINIFLTFLNFWPVIL